MAQYCTYPENKPTKYEPKSNLKTQQIREMERRKINRTIVKDTDTEYTEKEKCQQLYTEMN